MRITTLAVLTLLLVVAVADGADSPFRAVTQTRLGTPITRPGYDLQPTILFDREEANPARRFKMWWLGQHPSPAPGTPADRIYYAESAEASTWSAPVPVLEPRLGADGADAADDHLLGSPTVLRRNGKFFMFYEAYGTWATVVNRLYSFARGDNWTTHGTPQCQDDACTITNPDWEASYDRPERVVHGFAPRYRKAGTHAIYSGEVRYANGPKFNRFLRLAPTPVRTDPNGDAWRQSNAGQPVFWLYDSPGPGRRALYSFWDGANRNTFTSTDPGAEGVPNVVPDLVNGGSHVLGYVADSLVGPDLLGCLQNRIMLATSTDGTNWTRFAGAARGGAVLAPQNERTGAQGFPPPPPPCTPAHERWDIHRAYGSGYPMSTTRDGFLELHFTDDSLTFASQPCAGLSFWRIRLPVTEIENPQAYLTAARQANALAGDDVKWSPLFRRYFALTFFPMGNTNGILTNQVPKLVWSERDPDPANPPTFPPGNELLMPLPADRWAATGGILCDGSGNTVDFFAPDVPASYSALHLFYEEMPAGDVSVFSRNLGHTLVFAYPPVDSVVPIITAQPASLTVNEGSNVSFAVAATGTAPLAYQWQKNGTAVAGATSAVFSISNARPSDAGAYRVVVTNAAGRATSNDAMLTVLATQRLMLTNVSWGADRRLRFRVVGVANQPCVVERSSDLPGWIPIGSFSLVNGAADFLEAAPSGLPRSFYRAVIRSNTAPTVFGGQDIRLVSRAPITVALNGQVFDDGLPVPPGRVTSAWTQIEGPAPVVFSDASAPATSITLSAPGVYRLRLSASDGSLSSVSEVTIDLDANAAPVVDAGSNLSTVLPAAASLQGVATDDGLPNPPGRLTLTWSKATGPGTVTFANPNAARTTATFSAAGTYRLWLTAFDGAKRSSNTTVVTVIANQPPTVNLGPSRVLTLPAPTTPGVQPPGYLDFRPTVTDDGLPNPPHLVTGQWSQASGPAAAGFGAPSGVSFSTFTNRIYFPVAGTYVLRLAVSDGSLSTASNVTVQVSPPPNAQPVAHAGPSRSIDLPDAAVLAGSSSDDGLPIPPARLTNGWSKASGPGAVFFANAALASTTATFSEPGSYTLRLTAGDGEKSDSDAMSVTVHGALEYLTTYQDTAQGHCADGYWLRARNTHPTRAISYVITVTRNTISRGEYTQTKTGTLAPGASSPNLTCTNRDGGPGGDSYVTHTRDNASF